jgi:hypothetical protein
MGVNRRERVSQQTAPSAIGHTWVLYDGLNPVHELNGSNGVVANVPTRLGIGRVTGAFPEPVLSLGL